MRTLLTNSLAGLVPELDATTQQHFEKLFASRSFGGSLTSQQGLTDISCTNKHEVSGAGAAQSSAARSPVYQLSLDLIVHITGRVIFGSELGGCLYDRAREHEGLH